MPEPWLTYDSFAALVDTVFTARVAHSDVPLTLVAADNTEFAGGASADGQLRTQFSLLFRGPAEPALDQGSYELRNGSIGTQLIFIVPIREDAEGRYYEAVFA